MEYAYPIQAILLNEIQQRIIINKQNKECSAYFKYLQQSVEYASRNSMEQNRRYLPLYAHTYTEVGGVEPLLIFHHFSQLSKRENTCRQSYVSRARILCACAKFSSETRGNISSFIVPESSRFLLSGTWAAPLNCSFSVL